MKAEFTYITYGSVSEVGEFSQSLIFVMLLKSFLKCITLGNVIFFNWVTLIFRDKLFQCTTLLW